MRRALIALPFLIVLVSFTSFAQENRTAASQQTPGTTTSTSSLLRKAYPGGRDESDLTVQPRKRITRKGGSGDEVMEGEGPEVESSSDSEDFGE